MNDGWRYNLTVTLNVKKMLIAAAMVFSVWLACKIGNGDVLLAIIPAGIYGLFSKEV